MKPGPKSKEKDELMVRINISLPLSLAQEFRSRVPDKERSALVTRLIEKYLTQEQQKGEHSNG